MEEQVLHHTDCECQECSDKWITVQRELKKHMHSMGYKFNDKVFCCKTWGKIDEQDNRDRPPT